MSINQKYPHGLKELSIQAFHPSPAQQDWLYLCVTGVSLVTSGLLAAIFVTGALYLVGTGTNSRRDNRRVEVPSYGYRYPDRREDGLFQQMERIISSLSLESLQGVISNIKHEILGSLSTARDDEVQRVDEDAQSSIGNGITDTLELLGGGSQVEDCLLQVN